MYLGPPIDDFEILRRLPAELAQFLHRANGYVAFHGGLHVRGACRAPEWHSLRAAWDGSHALARLFPTLDATDVPFAEDALGHQFILRGSVVHRLDAEIGEVESLNVDLAGFDAAVRADPVGYLCLQPLERFRAEGGTLEPGQLLNVYPPYVFKESADSVSLRAIPALERLEFLAHLAAAIKGLPGGTNVRILPPRGAV